MTKTADAGRRILAVHHVLPVFAEKRHEESFIGCGCPYGCFVWIGGSEQKAAKWSGRHMVWPGNQFGKGGS